MEFSGQYLTYTEYSELGGTLEQSLFNLLEYEARCQINITTHNRLINVETIPNEVKICMFKLIEQIQGYASTLDKVRKNGNLASEQTDGYSVSFIGSSEIQQIVSSKNQELQDTILKYLYGVIVNNEHIIFNGV